VLKGYKNGYQQAKNRNIKFLSDNYQDCSRKQEAKVKNKFHEKEKQNDLQGL